MKIEELRSYVFSNIHKISQTNTKIIPNFDERIIYNIKKLGGFNIPDNIDTEYKLLLYLDSNKGICNYHSCTKEKKKKRNWVLNEFCSKKCASKKFSENQKLDNTSKRMTKESKNRMRLKLSEVVKNKIRNGDFKPAATNSWCHSRINLIINNKEVKVRSSWEAIFYLINPNLSYENIIIPYYDSKNGKNRNYIVDFCDFDNRILYEIKPIKQGINCKDKELASLEWCKTNKYRFIYIDEIWILNNYNKKILLGQPDAEKISYRIEKLIKSENKKNR